MTKMQRQHCYLSTCFCATAKTPGSSSTASIAGGVAAGAALLFAVPAIGFAWWRRRRPIEAFFDVPGKTTFRGATVRFTESNCSYCLPSAQKLTSHVTSLKYELYANKCNILKLACIYLLLLSIIDKIGACRVMYLLV